MHPTILAKRKADATRKLVTAADALARQAEIDPELIKGMNRAGIHDRQARELMFLEGVANVVTAVAIHSGAIKEGVSAETAGTPAEQPEEIPADGASAAEAVEAPDAPVRTTRRSASRKSKK